MTATFGASPNSKWQTIAPLLQSLGCAPGDETSPETWYLGEQNFPEGKLLLAYTYPQQALVYAMENGQEPTEALKQWEEHTHALVTLYKNNRRRAALVNVQQVASNLERAAETLASHWQRSIELPDIPEKTAEQTADPYCQLIATIAIHQNKRLSPLLAQLEACSLPVAEYEQAAEPEQDLNALYWGLKNFRRQTDQLEDLAKQYQALDKKHLALEQQREAVQKERKDQENTLQNDREENKLLLDQLHLVQEELERSLRTSKKERTASDALRSELKELKIALASTEEKQGAGAIERDKLQKALNTAQTQQKEYRKEADKLSQDLEQAREQHRQAAATLEEENCLVIEQLHLVQEELEQQLINEWALEKQLKQLTQEQDHALAVANNQINRLQNELHQLKNSAAWKAAAPMRALGRPFRDKRKLKKQANQLAESPFFDADWYLKTYPDVAEKKMNPAEHYLKFGADEGRDPSKDFDTQWYVQANPDVQDSGINPLIHFLNHGQAEGRAPNPQTQTSLPSPQEVK